MSIQDCLLVHECILHIQSDIIPYIWGFSRVTKFVIMRKMCSIFNLRRSLFAISNVYLIENNTGHDFCVINNLPFKRECKKSENQIIVISDILVGYIQKCYNSIKKENPISLSIFSDKGENSYLTSSCPLWSLC